MGGFVTRFAPSPTGALHLGHAFSALTAWDAAQAAGGVFLLRLEDIDLGRCRPAYEAAIFEDLAWLGLRWPLPVWRQSERLGLYGAALAALTDRGLVYRCFRTRREVMAEIASAPHGPIEVFRGAPLAADLEAEKLSAGAAFAWRLSLSTCQAALGDRWSRLGFEADGRWVQADPLRLGDVVLGRKEFPASYHLASVLDDAKQGVTHIIRGEDLREAADLHVLLQALLGFATPVYCHHRLIVGADGKRLAKRDKAMSLQALRDGGKTPGEVRRLVGLCR